MKGRRLVDDLPAAVRLTAGGAVARLRYAADDHGLLILAAIPVRARLPGAYRRHGAGMATIRIVPGDCLASRCLFKRRLLGVAGVKPVAAVEALADRTAGDRTEQGADRRGGEPAMA